MPTFCGIGEYKYCIFYVPSSLRNTNTLVTTHMLTYLKITIICRNLFTRVLLKYRKANDTLTMLISFSKSVGIAQKYRCLANVRVPIISATNNLTNILDEILATGK